MGKTPSILDCSTDWRKFSAPPQWKYTPGGIYDTSITSRFNAFKLRTAVAYCADHMRKR
jgi:hypothetical protein